MDLGLSGKIAVVTGGSRGIGRAVAETLAAEGCDLLLAARSADMLERAAAAIRRSSSRRVETIALDLREPTAPSAIEQSVMGLYGRIDILVNNAGATKSGDFLKLGDADWRDGFALKFFGHMRLSRAMWPHLVASRGVIVNIIGGAGKTPNALFTIGGAVNAACMNLSNALAQRGIADGVRVVAVNPGPIRTDRLEQLLAQQAEAQGIGKAELAASNLKGIGIARYGEALEVAKLVAYLASPAADHIRGEQVFIDGGQTKSL